MSGNIPVTVSTCVGEFSGANEKGREGAVPFLESLFWA